MFGMRQGKLFAWFLLPTLLLAAQQPTTPTANQQPQKTPSPPEVQAAAPEVDVQALVKETENLDMRRRKLGIFWWVPPEYWEASLRMQGYNSEDARQIFAPFKNYNLFVIAIGDVEVGDISWTPEAEIKKNTALRDQRGNKYKPIDEMPADVSRIVQLMRPVFKNMMGNFGAGIQFLLFPIKDGAGTVFADPRKSSELFLDVSDLMGTGTTTYAWRFPLTALSPPKYCPIGKEKVEASWKFCPWHGNKLMDDTAATQTAAPASK